MASFACLMLVADLFVLKQRLGEAETAKFALDERPLSEGGICHRTVRQ